MPTAPAPPPAAEPDPSLGMCLRHADYHPMDSDCWGDTFQWLFDHQHIPESERQAAYDGEVERAMLDLLVQEYQLPNVSRRL